MPPTDNALVEKVITALRTALTEALGPDQPEPEIVKDLQDQLDEALSALNHMQQFVTDAAATVANAIYDLESLDTYEVSQPLEAAKASLTAKSE